MEITPPPVAPTAADSWLASMRRLVVPGLWLLAIVTAVVTYRQIAHTPSVEPSAHRIWLLMAANFLIIGGLAGLYARRGIITWLRLRQQGQIAGLKKRMMLAFGLVTMVPTLLVSIFAFFTFNLGIQSWFNERVKTGLSESLVVAEAYFKEHKDNLRTDAIAMANDLSRAGGLSFSSPIEFNRLVDAQAEMRLLSEVIVFRKNRIIAQGRLSFALAFESVPVGAIERAENGEVVIFTDDSTNKVRALIEIKGLPQTYLLIGRLIDGRVLSYMEETQGAYKQYMELRERIGEIQFIISLVFLALALLLLLGALWYALVFATKLTSPITDLVTAAERIRSGDYSARVDVKNSRQPDEVDTLSLAFNRMADQLEAQRGDLITANRTLDERRRFSEAVLAGVSSGVMALNEHLEITLVNRSAEKLLLKEGSTVEALVGQRLEVVVPDMHGLLAELRQNPTKQISGNIQHSQGEKRLTLHARVTSEMMDDRIFGYIATFDDITPLISAQRQAAWSDVARRIAHEIKNPLTPIALAAQRLKKKYAGLVGSEETENFNRYTDTIEHHVGNIGRMVEEFVQFARIPNPVFANVDVNELVRKAIFTEKVSHSDISYQLQLHPTPMIIAGDERLLSQLMVNLLKNAAEAMQDSDKPPLITITTTVAEGQALVIIHDSGMGVAEDQREKIFEPYVTTRAKGTGLGLAISKKIVEDHKGSISLKNHDEGGAVVQISFPLKHTLL